MTVKVITDSGSGLSEKQAGELGIGFLPLQVNVDGQSYLDGVNLPIEELYSLLENGKMPTTSQPPLYLQEELLEKLSQEGITDLVLVNLSSGLSGTNATLQATADRMDMKVHTLDIYTTLFVQKYLALAAQQLLEQETKPEKIIEILKEAVDKSSGYLLADDLDHLAAGGRLTPMAAKLGGLLKIKPILEVSKRTEGKVDVYDKVRTMNKAIKKAVDHIKEEIGSAKNYELLILNGNNDEGTAMAVQALKEAFGDEASIHVDPLYAVIACHTGLGSVGIQYIPKIEGVSL